MGKANDVCEGETIVRVVQVVHGLPDDLNLSWVTTTGIVTALRQLNHHLGARPRQYVVSYLERLVNAGWLTGRDGAEGREYHTGVRAVRESGKDHLERLRQEFRAQIAEARKRATAADTPRERRGLPPELDGVLDIGDDPTPLTPSDFGTMLGVITLKLVRGGIIQPPPPASAIEKLSAAVNELCGISMPTAPRPAAAPT